MPQTALPPHTLRLPKKHLAPRGTSLLPHDTICGPNHHPERPRMTKTCLLTLLLSLGLASCGGGNSTATQPPADTTHLDQSQWDSLHWS